MSLCLSIYHKVRVFWLIDVLIISILSLSISKIVLISKTWLKQTIYPSLTFHIYLNFYWPFRKSSPYKIIKIRPCVHVKTIFIYCHTFWNHSIVFAYNNPWIISLKRTEIGSIYDTAYYDFNNLLIRCM